MTIEYWYQELGLFCKDELETAREILNGRISISFSNMAGNCTLCIKEDKKVGKLKALQKLVCALISKLHDSERAKKLLEGYIEAKQTGKFVIYWDGGYTMNLLFDEARKVAKHFSLSKRSTHEGYPIITICGQKDILTVLDWLQSESIDYIKLDKF